MKSPWGLAAALIVLAVGASAAEWTWEQCVAQAGAANPDLASGRLLRDQARQNAWKSVNGLLPAASLSNSWEDSKGAGGASRWNAGLGASLSLSLDAVSDMRSASASLRVSEANLRKASADLRLQLRRAFTRLHAAQQALAASEKIKALRLHDSELVDLRYQSGRESKGNRLRAKVQLASADAELAQARRELRLSRRELLRRLGREDFEELTAAGAVKARALPPPPDDPAVLLSLRPEIAAAQASVDVRRADRLAARSAFFPSFSAGYSRTRSGPTEFPSARYSWAASATVSYPLFGSGPTASLHAVQSANLGLEAAQRQLESARQAGLLDVESAWADYASAVEQQEIALLRLDAARQRNEEADVRYASGLLSFDLWEPIVNERVEAERSAIGVVKTAADAEAAWDRALGRALGE